MTTIDLELRLAKNALGNGLSPDLAHRLRRVVACPSVENWEDAHTIILSRDFLTLWQAVCIIDPAFPTTGRVTDTDGRVLREWSAVPTREVLIRALRYATH